MQFLGVSLCSAVLILGISSHAEAVALKKGATGGAVSDLQNRLEALGYDLGEVDGVYGQSTISAVERFQRDFGLVSDGIVGDETRWAMENAAGRSQIVSRGTSARSLVPGIIATSKRYLGIPYVFGGEDPSGFDCSGFIQYVFGKQGIDMPRTADVQYGLGVAVSMSNLLPGDLVYFSTYLPGPSHVGIYLGNGQFINAQSSKGVAIASMSSSYWASRYVGAKRVLR